MDPLTIMAISGAVMQAYGTYQSAQAESSLLQQQAQLNDIRSNEILQRAAINSDITREKSQEAMSDLQARSQGAGIGSQTILAGMEETARLAAREIYNINRDANFEATMQRFESDSQRRQAGEIRQAGTISALGGLAKSLGQTAYSRPGGIKATSTESYAGSGTSILGDTGRISSGPQQMSAGIY